MLAVVDLRTPNLPNFIRTFRHHLVVVLGGGGLVVLLGLFERFSLYSLSRWAYGLFIAAVAIVASYRAWKDERHRVNELEDRIQKLEEKPAQAVPKIQVEIDEAIIEPVLHNTMRCFLRVMLRNLTENAPCIVERCSLSVRIGDEWYESGTTIDVKTVELVTSDQLEHPSLVPMNTTYHVDEGGLPIIEVGREDIPSLLDSIGEDQPLRRGFPKLGWLGFFVSGLPNWPTQTKGTGHYESEMDRETGKEFFVEQQSVVRSTKIVRELKLQIIDGHGGGHSASKARPFGVWSRSIEDRRPKDLKMY